MVDFIYKIKRVIIKAIIFALFFCTIDVVFGILLEHFYFQQKRKLTYALEQCNEDVLLFGSSRAQHHFNTKVIADSVGFSAYNLGSGGQNIFYHYAILKSILARYTPKLVVLTIETIDIYKTPAAWDKEKLSAFYPYYFRDKTVQEVVDFRSNYEHYKMFSNLYRYNSEIVSIMMLKMFYNDMEIAYQNGGYIPIPEEPHYKGAFSIAGEGFGQKIDTLKIEYINKFISLCKDNNVECILVITPWFANFADNYLFVDEVNELSLFYDTPFLNYINDKEFIRADYFKDKKHLNSKGANVFSSKFALDLKDFLHKTDLVDN